jgi:hypothetical protein
MSALSSSKKQTLQKAPATEIAGAFAQHDGFRGWAAISGLWPESGHNPAEFGSVDKKRARSKRDTPVSSFVLVLGAFV